jgi:putative transcriptional regulator
MTSRNLLAEFEEGFDALSEQRTGKRTLRTHSLENKPIPEISPEQIIALRRKLNISRPVFADYLRTKDRTLENWEQGRAKPNAQATVLIHLVEKYPDTVKRLATI